MDTGNLRNVEPVAVSWQDIRNQETGDLLCRIAPVVGLLWFRQRGQDTFIDIRQIITHLEQKCETT